MVVTVHYVGFHPSLTLQGFEKIRIAYPIEKVYIFFDSKQDKYGVVSRYNAKKLEKTLSFFKPQLVGCNPLSFTNVFTKMYALLKVEVDRGRKVLLDITDMPPIAVAAATTVAMSLPNVHIYTVHADRRGDFIPDPGTPDFEDWIERKDSLSAVNLALAPLPRERLTLIDEGKSELEEEVLLKMLEMKGRAESITQLIEWMGENPDSVTVKARYSRLVKELERKGFVVVSRGGKRREVRLSEFGLAYAEALKKAKNLEGRLREEAPPLNLQPEVVETLSI